MALAACAGSNTPTSPPTATPAPAADTILCGHTDGLQWVSTPPLLTPISDATHPLVSIKDPSIVFFNGRWHVYATTANTAGEWSMVFLSFADWSEVADARPYYLDANPRSTGYHCAPQVFYFRPQHNRAAARTTTLSSPGSSPCCA